jgi:hypothetical protein
MVLKLQINKVYIQVISFALKSTLYYNLSFNHHIILNQLITTN